MSSGKEDPKGRVRVYVRCRPPNNTELADPTFKNVAEVVPPENRITIHRELEEPKNFNFDGVLQPTITQQEVYDAVAAPVVMDVLQGYNGTVMAYGQTGTGKTHTLSNLDPVEAGIIPRSMRHIFRQVAEDKEHTYTVRISYVQIYMEMIQDLLSPENTNLQIREDPEKGVYIAGVSITEISSPEECFELLRKGDENRAVANTNMNATSSRSHSVLLVYVSRAHRMTDSDYADTAVKTNRTVLNGKLVLVDLAGSERVKKTGAVGVRKDEGIAINLSLSALGNVIHALTDSKTAHVPYRDSKLTRLLQDSLGGNCKTSLIVTVGPALYNVTETISSLLFGRRAMKVATNAKINQDVDYKALALKLQAQLDTRDEDVRRAEAAVQKATAENERLRDLLAQREAMIESMRATGFIPPADMSTTGQTATTDNTQPQPTQQQQQQQHAAVEVSALLSAKATLERELAEMTRERDVALEALQQNEAEHQETCNRYEMEATLLMDELEQQVSTHEAEKEEWLAEKRALDAEINELTSQLAAAHDAVRKAAHANTDHEELIQQLEQLEDAVEELRLDKEDAEAEAATLHERLEEIDQEHSEQLAQARDREQKLAAALNALAASMNSLDKTRAATDTQTHHMQLDGDRSPIDNVDAATVQTNQQTADEAQTDQTAAAAEMHIVPTVDVANVSQRVAALQQAIESRIQQADQHVAAAAEQIIHYLVENIVLQATYEAAAQAWQHHVEELQQELTTTKQKSTDLQQQNSQLTELRCAEQKQHEEKLQTASEQLRAAEAQRQTDSAQITQLQCDVAALKKRCDALQAELATVYEHLEQSCSKDHVQNLHDLSCVLPDQRGLSAQKTSALSWLVPSVAAAYGLRGFVTDTELSVSAEIDDVVAGRAALEALVNSTEKDPSSLSEMEIERLIVSEPKFETPKQKRKALAASGAQLQTALSALEQTEQPTTAGDVTAPIETAESAIDTNASAAAAQSMAPIASQVCSLVIASNTAVSLLIDMLGVMSKYSSSLRRSCFARTALLCHAVQLAARSAQSCTRYEAQVRSLNQELKQRSQELARSLNMSEQARHVAAVRVLQRHWRIRKREQARRRAARRIIQEQTEIAEQEILRAAHTTTETASLLMNQSITHFDTAMHMLSAFFTDEESFAYDQFIAGRGSATAEQRARHAEHKFLIQQAKQHRVQWHVESSPIDIRAANRRTRAFTAAQVERGRTRTVMNPLRTKAEGLLSHSPKSLDDVPHRGGTADYNE